MSKTKVMICGASGFIGCNLFKHYDALSRYETFGTYLKNRPSPANLGGVTSNGTRPRIIQADLRDMDVALSVTRGMDIVINAAAMTDGIGVFSDDEKAQAYAEANNLINANLAEAAYTNSVKHFVFLSCTVMYPSSPIPLPEDRANTELVHPKYLIPAEMKIFGEERCRYFAGLGSTKYTVVRHTNIYGPHDKFDFKRSHVLPATIEKVMTSNSEIVVWGRGQESRDFLYIEDQIDFIRTAIHLQKNSFEVFNVGSGRTYSINELVDIIIACSGKKLNIVHDLTKPSVETHMNIDVDKARHLLGWRAKTELQEGILQTIEWYLESRNTA